MGPVDPAIAVRNHAGADLIPPDDEAWPDNDGACGWRSIAWDGIRIKVPRSWELHTLDKGYLKMVADGGFAFEIKWRRRSRNFKVERFLAGFVKKQRRRIDGQMDLRPMPPNWQAALPEADLGCFSWAAEGRRACGVAIHCRKCQTASLMQVSGLPPKQLDAIIGQLLAAFRDHHEAPWQVWQLFDIRARVPAAYALQRHRFLPGSFLLEFRAGRKRLGLYRWGPAGSLLEDLDLKQFACQQFGPRPEKGQWIVQPDGPAWGWHIGPGAGWRRWLTTPRRRAHRHESGRIWHLRGANRMLAVVMSGQRPIDQQSLERICRNYDCQP